MGLKTAGIFHPTKQFMRGQRNEAETYIESDQIRLPIVNNNRKSGRLRETITFIFE